jgi:toluene monooxygenase electron transfer component
MKNMDAAREGCGAFVRLEPEGLQFQCQAGATLLSAALAAGIDLPYECASGGCGSCRARLLEGQVRSLWPDAPGLSKRDRLKGDRILCCQSVAQTDCVVQLRAGPTAPPVRPALVPARVKSLRMLNHEVMHLVLTAGEAMHFLPGQFVLFDLPNGIGRRAYSMSNANARDGCLEFLIKRKPQGAAGTYLFETLRVNDTLEVDGPYGRSWLREERTDQDLVLLAGGSGLAPVWSIAQAALMAQANRRIHLYFCVNKAQDLFWQDEIRAVQARAPNLRLHLVLAEAPEVPPPDSRLGLAAAVLAQDFGGRLAHDLYMAGPPGMIDSVLRELVSTGMAQADRVFFDRFC